MTPSELKYRVADTEPYFFSRDTMRFFGDSMANYGCRKTVIRDKNDVEQEVYELWRKTPVKHGLQSSAYFDAKTFEQVFCF